MLGLIENQQAWPGMTKAQVHSDGPSQCGQNIERQMKGSCFSAGNKPVLTVLSLIAVAWEGALKGHLNPLPQESQLDGLVTVVICFGTPGFAVKHIKHSA